MMLYEILLAHETFGAKPICDPERFHDVPGRVVRTAQVAHLAVLHQLIERAHGLIGRGLAVPAVGLVEVDVVRTQPPETPLDRLDDVVSGQAAIVGPVADHGAALARDEQPVAAPGDDLTHGFLGPPETVHVRGIDEVDSGIERHVQHSSGFRDLDLPHRLALVTAEREGTQSKNRDPQS